MSQGFLILESGEVFRGLWGGGQPSAGEIVFNTAHSGYEEVATDPSYFNQIVLMTSSQMGNYGHSQARWESDRFHIKGFMALEIQKSPRDRQWVDRLATENIPTFSEFDTRSLTLRLRDQGTIWGALVKSSQVDLAKSQAKELIEKTKEGPSDWVSRVTRKQVTLLDGEQASGPKVTLVDFGTKQNIVRELLKRCSKVQIVPATTSADKIKQWEPDGILLSNGPGDPSLVEGVIENIQALLGWKPLFGICMGHQLLGRALGAKTYALKFGHRGGNHPIKDILLNKVYITSQNHGYAIDEHTLPEGVDVTHRNLNDQTVSGLRSEKYKCFSVQFHPESHPGPRDAESLFDYFVESLR